MGGCQEEVGAIHWNRTYGGGGMTRGGCNEENEKEWKESEEW